MSVAGLCELCAESNRIHEVIVTLRGIKLHPKTYPGQQPADWVEVFPHLEEQPRQVDLLKTEARNFAAKLLEEKAAVPAGIYDQVRVLLVPDQTSIADQLPEENACGASQFNCVIMAEGRAQALVFEGDTSEVRITSQSLAGGFLLIPPDSEGKLSIELVPVWLAIVSSGGSMGFQPVITGRAEFERKTDANELD